MTLAFTTDQELKLFMSRQEGLKIMANDALKNANIGLSFEVEK